MPSDQMHRLAELLKNPQPLHPELGRHLVKTPGGFYQIKHPLSYILLYIPEMNAVYNETYNAKVAFRDRARANKKWLSYIFCHERAWRLDALESVKAEMDPLAYWKMLGTCWSDSENLYQYGQLIPKLVNDPRPCRQSIMSAAERRLFASLPDTLAVYRGHYVHNRAGWSWSLSHWKARWFSARQSPERRVNVVRGMVSKQDVIAVLTRRKEYECIIDPEKVEGVKAFKPEVWESKYYKSLALDGANPLADGAFSVHGTWHWWKVHYNADQLCKQVDGADPTVCIIFAYLHDCRRVNENDDPEHGERAAAYVEELYGKGRLGDLTDSQREKLVTAVRDHEKGTVSDDPTIGVCWDADRLDLMRVGIAPDPKLLSTDAAKELVWKI